MQQSRRSITLSGTSFCAQSWQLSFTNRSKKVSDTRGPSRSPQQPMATPGAAVEPERVAFVLIDGVGDVTIPQLGGRTPLQAATLPHLDAVAGAAVWLRRCGACR